MIHFVTTPLRHEGILMEGVFHIPDSPSTEEVLNIHARLYKGKRFGSMDPELDLFNFVAKRWPFIALISRNEESFGISLTPNSPYPWPEFAGAENLPPQHG